MFILYIHIIKQIFKNIFNLIIKKYNNININNIFITNIICITTLLLNTDKQQKQTYIHWFSKKTYDIDYVYKYIFKNIIHIYIDNFRHNEFNTKDTNKNTINCNKSILYKSSFPKNEFFSGERSISQYEMLEFKIDKSDFDKYIENKRSINITYKQINKIYYDEIINYDSSVKIYYDKFVNLFNDYDNNIIKIGVYGQENIGKTFFLKNIIKIIKKYNKCYTTNFYKHLVKYENNNYNYTIYDDFIESSLLSSYDRDSCIINILYLTIDNFDYKLLKYFNNNKFLGQMKTILMIETIKYNNYFDNFDIKFEPNFKI